MLKSKINLAIWNSREWQEVSVPRGVYQVGVDEYAWNGSEWIHLGNKYDLTGYLREEDLADYAKTADVESQFQTIQYSPAEGRSLRYGE